MLCDVDLPLRIEHLLIRLNNTDYDLLVHRLAGEGGSFLEQIGTVNLPLRLERIEGHPLSREARREIFNRLREVQCVQRKIGLRELSLPKTGSESVNRIVAAGDVFGKAELRQQLRARHSCRGFGIAVASAGNRSLRALLQGLIDYLPLRQRFLRRSGKSPHPEQKRQAETSIKARIHWVKCPSTVHSNE